jgi:hypothetical protein
MTPALPVEGELPGFDAATGWLNTRALNTADLHGKVTLVNFCTYTCINWLRQLPYVRAWAAGYAGQGLAVIGVHTPEFGFERNADNVRRALRDLRVAHPVALDNHYGIWRAFHNDYWPALYLADTAGLIRYHHFGEGGYEQTENLIQRLLAVEAREPVRVAADGAEAPADWASLRSPETYTGYERATNFASPEDPVLGKRIAYSAPAELRPSQWALSGSWTMGEQGVTLDGLTGSLVYRFHARDLHLVMGPDALAAPVRFGVLIDGQPPGAAHGADVAADGHGLLADQRLYQLIRQPGPVTDRTFEISFRDPGARAFAFTFG